MSYRRFQIDLTPSALRGPNGERWSGGLGSAKDALLARARQAVYLGGISDDTGRGREAPADGLAYLGRDADIARLPAESDADYRTRLAAAWDAHGWHGTNYGLAYALSLTGLKLTGTRTVAQAEWSAVPDGLTGLWSRFWLYVWTGALRVGRFTLGPWAQIGGAASSVALTAIGKFTIGSGTIGSTLSTTDLREIRRTLATWKSARDRVPSMTISDGNVIGLPGLAVGGGWTLGGSQLVITRNLVIGAFKIGALPADDPDGPWWPRIGRNFLV